MNEIIYKKVEIKTNQYILLIIFFALIGSLLIFVFNRLIDEKIIENKNIQKQQIALESRIENIGKLETEYDKIKPEIDFINNYLPTQDKIVEMIDKLERLASDNKLDISIDFTSEPVSHNIKASLALKGYYSDFMNFYKGIFNESLLINVNSISLTDANSLTDNVQAIMNVEVYFD